jgi:hypothetical protein
MTQRTIGDTSPTHASARFIALDSTAVGSADAAHAGFMRRIGRNSNWLECKSRRMLVCEAFHLRGTDVSGIIGKSAPENEHWYIRGRQPVCMGPWKIQSTRPQIKVQVGFGANSTNVFRFHVEMASENRPDGWVPNADEWTSTTAGGGAPQWYDSAIITKQVAQPLDWMRIWVATNDETTFTPVEGGPPASSGPGSLAAAGAFTIVKGDHRRISAELDGGVGWFAGDFDDGRVSIVIYDDNGAGGGNVLDVVRATPYLEETDVDGDGVNEAVMWLDGPRYTSPDARPYDGHAAQFRKSGRAVLRYVIAYEEELTTLDDTAAGRRPDFVPCDDMQANTGETRMALLATQHQNNADALILRNGDTIVNQVLATPAYSGTGANMTSYYGLLVTTALAFTPVCKHRFFAELGMGIIAVQCSYVARGVAGDNVSRCEVRWRLLDDSETLVVASSEQDFDLNINEQWLGGVTGATARTNIDGAWLGRWMHHYTPLFSPVWFVDFSSYTGAEYVLEWQIRAKASANSNDVMFYPVTYHVASKPRV